MGNVDRVLAAVLGGLLLLAAGACSQPWQFARAEHVTPGARAAGMSPDLARETADLADCPGLRRLPPQSPRDVPDPWEPPPVSPASYGPLSGMPGGVPAEQADAGPVFGPAGESALVAAPASPYASCAAPGLGTRLRAECRAGWWRICEDHRHYYCCDTMRDLFCGVAGGAVLANTSLDGDFQSWYQHDVRSSGTDEFATFWKTFGEGQIFIPAYAGLAVVGGMFPQRPLVAGVGEFSDRVTRGYLVGAPPMLFMQALLGASRPGESDVESQWKPFDDSNGVSGHAFVGAVPFITAARMCHRPLVKATFLTLSTFPAWSRVNDDAHYLSQACLGWWMAYLACRAVDHTDSQQRDLTFTPWVAPEVAGVGLVYRR